MPLLCQQCVVGRRLKSKTLLIFILSLVTSWSVCIAAPARKAAGAEQIQALEWRNVGPHVGVRGCAVLAHPTQRSVFNENENLQVPIGGSDELVALEMNGTLDDLLTASA